LKHVSLKNLTNKMIFRISFFLDSWNWSIL